MILEDIIDAVKDELSVQRFAHTRGVAETAEALAVRFGADPEKAKTAGWIHDIAREWSVDRAQDFARKIDVPQGFSQVPTLLHGPIAAYMLQHRFGLKDEDTANAVKYHTTGRAGMSLLEKVVCLADAIEPGRDFPDVPKIRDLATRDINRALAESFDSVIRFLLEEHRIILPLTVTTRNDLWRQVENGYDD
ncbi:bis(5'-nucleosyl)-tetraphosphatase (symmetrical) YqeK [Alicyclobacillus sp. SO9]|uniref:bis(5'-nucleosyl)-tetraphosphatase (symmetrical) YqeK n=1 Tax=Alicyclobacillus sp. SO9 TaxID=2665646 RepID=UPI0018E841A7|nr:bis(5'-nucleosyl)-tetraphosphatase (symmetrical) YqeK [Alicyclobacillus sp. SO9]QQE77360.1 bis(5'-nucleosyl)-tetraphosphatase (symmetrical) YqeK [Alicyclobacillus sp. SO9]